MLYFMYFNYSYDLRSFAHATNLFFFLLFCVCLYFGGLGGAKDPKSYSEDPQGSQKAPRDPPRIPKGPPGSPRAPKDPSGSPHSLPSVIPRPPRAAQTPPGSFFD